LKNVDADTRITQKVRGFGMINYAKLLEPLLYINVKIYKRGHNNCSEQRIK